MMSAVFTLSILTLAELQHISAESTLPPMPPPPTHRPPTFTFLLTVFREAVLFTVFSVTLLAVIGKVAS